MRLCACLGLTLDIIEPCGFIWDERKIRQSGMDYTDLAVVKRHTDWNAFRATYPDRRLILLTTKGAVPYTDITFNDGDILIAGRESAGVPDDVHNAVDIRALIPMHAGARSLNVINASAMVLGEAIRQTHIR